MASQANPGTRILGTGHYAPAKVVTNLDLERRVDTSDAWIVERTGIRERRIAEADENTSDMAAAAARAALASAGLEATELDMIIIATISGDVLMPATAVYVQQKIGAGPIPAFDISAACAGFLYGLSIADQFVRTGQARNVLVCGVELLSRIINWDDRTTCVLFGDGAGAVVVGRNGAEGEGRGVISTQLYADGAMAGALLVPAGGTRLPLTPELLAARENTVHMSGSEVFKVAVRNLTSACKAALDAAGMAAGDIDWVVAHQANLRILAQVAARLEIPIERFVMNLERYGNTSSASIPIALDEAVRDGRVCKGQTVLMCALGAGVAWASALVRM